MRPVNLLPPKHRPRTVEERKGSGYVLLAALAALFVGTLGYVLMGNVAASREDQAVLVKQEADQAEARAGALQPYAQFAELRQTREGSVKQLAGARFDWERSIRELARALPGGVWLTTVEASTTGPQEGSPTGSPTATSGSTPAAAPSLKLTGCARSQRTVAATLVRLRALHGVADVTLADSGRAASGGASSATTTTAAPGAATCQDYTFNASISFNPQAGTETGAAKVPASLGGGQ
jgi:Tfp pilus assembly protein PilN